MVGKRRRRNGRRDRAGPVLEVREGGRASGAKWAGRVVGAIPVVPKLGGRGAVSGWVLVGGVSRLGWVDRGLEWMCLRWRVR